MKDLIKRIFSRKKLIFFFITFVLILSTILLIVYKYNISNNGYKISFSNINNVSNKEYKKLIEYKKIALSSFNIIKQKIVIYEPNAEYMYIFLEDNENIISEIAI